MSFVTAVTPLPKPLPTLCDLPLPQRLSLLGQPALIAELCELHDRLARLEHLLDLPPLATPPPAATATASPTAPAPPGTEVIEELGHGWQIIRRAGSDTP